jgi:cation diffusion facilitator family transporter
MFSTKSGALKLSIATATTLTLIKLVVGFLTGSISILAEALHSLIDLTAAVIAFISVKIADRPADEGHPFGHGKAENVSGSIEALLIFGAAILIIYEAINKLITGETVERLEFGIGIMGFASVANFLVSRHMLKVAKATDSVAVEADARHLMTDILTSASVMTGLILLKLTGFTPLDPIVALGVAVLIMRIAYSVIRKSIAGLIDVRLPKGEEDEIVSCIKEHTSQLAGFHEVRTRKSGSQRFIEFHLMLPKNTSVEDAHKMCDHLEEDLKNRLANSNITIHVEPCNVECDKCLVSSCSLRVDINLASQ